MHWTSRSRSRLRASLRWQLAVPGRIVCRSDLACLVQCLISEQRTGEREPRHRIPSRCSLSSSTISSTRWTNVQRRLSSRWTPEKWYRRVINRFRHFYRNLSPSPSVSWKWWPSRQPRHRRDSSGRHRCCLITSLMLEFFPMFCEPAKKKSKYKNKYLHRLTPKWDGFCMFSSRGMCMTQIPISRSRSKYLSARGSALEMKV